MSLPSCPVCAGTSWTHTSVIWPELASQWQISGPTLDYIDRQQGTSCARCGAQVRVAALADAIRQHYGWRRPLREMFVRRPWLRVLEVNTAGSIHANLGRYRHTFVEYPDVDIQDLPFPDGSFDLVVHSDTMEHVEDPVKGLRECRRVLRDRGVLAYTVPVVVDRMSRRRGVDEPVSYHGGESTLDYPVVSEYGADVWTEPMEAGFTSVTLCSFDYPAGLALVCLR